MARVTEEIKESTRTGLLEAAAREFARVGVDRANINEISLSAGWAKGTVYNYFSSKEALFMAVVEEACARAAEGDETVPGDASTRRRLRGLLASDIEWVRQDEDFARVLVREALTADRRFYAEIVAAAAPFIERVAEVLADGVARGEVRGDVSVEQLALVFTGMGELALIQHWGSGGSWPTLEEIPELVTRLFLEGAADSRSRDGRRASAR
jgi:AcrR family transcriptional regulator